MLNFLIYLGKVSLATGAFYLTYAMLFQQQKQFRFNRAYLLMAMVVSFVIPLITIPVIHHINVVVSGSPASGLVYFSGTTSKGSALEVEFSLYHYLFGFFLLGLLGFLLHLIISHLRAIRIIRGSRIQMCCNQKVRITTEDVHPFSFFNTIVISERTLSGTNLAMIVDHEKVHVQEYHTIDIFLAELMLLFQWFNPFAWLLKNAIRNNLEYKVDHEIIKTYHPQDYQLAMVALADKKEVSPFLTALNGSQLKNRIIMMKMKTTNKFLIVKQLVVIPLLAVLVVGLSIKEAKTENIHLKEKAGTIISNNQDDVISTSLDLRKAIAERIKFPVVAASMNDEIALSLYATISKSGEITKIEEEVAENIEFVTVDEVVVTAYGNNDEPEKSEADYRAVLSKEAERVLKEIHKFDIPEMKGKVVKFQFKFLTQ